MSLNDPPSATVAINVGGGDQTITATAPIDRIYVGGAGAIVARLRGDAADRTWTVIAGQYLAGDFGIIRQTGTTATGLIGCIAKAN